jgi:hypothetical protein
MRFFRHHIAMPLFFCASLSVTNPILLFAASCRQHGGCAPLWLTPTVSIVELTHPADEPPSSSSLLLYATTTAYATGGATEGKAHAENASVPCGRWEPGMIHSRRRQG